MNCIDLLTIFYKTIPSSLNIVGTTVKEILRHIEKSYGSEIDEEILFELRVVLNELIVNAIIHGNKFDVRKKIKITSGLTKDKRAYFIITDDGDGYDYNYILKKCNELPHMACNEHLSESGRGILIVKSLCEQIIFNKNGSEVMIIKKLEKD
ncbi:MAG TPA: ATP-binding protein [Clostridiaceae bacterium]|nr:ATP-binding protein [Clostridiaceae bacterium]